MGDWVQKQLERIHQEEAQKGGPGSGHWGHAGRPGQRGGSVPGSVAVSIRTGRTARERQAAARAAGQQKPAPEEGPDIPYADLTDEERRAYSDLLTLQQTKREALASAINPLREQIGRNSPRRWRLSADAAERQAEKWESGSRPSKHMQRLAKDKRKDAERFRRWADDLARQWQDVNNPKTIAAREAMRRASRDLRKLEAMYAEAKKLPRHSEARRLVQNSAKE